MRTQHFIKRIATAATLLFLVAHSTAYAAPLTETDINQIAAELYQKALQQGEAENSVLTIDVRYDENDPVSVSLDKWEVEYSDARAAEILECAFRMDYQYMCASFLQPMLWNRDGKYTKVSVFPTFPTDFKKEKIVRAKIEELGRTLKRNSSIETVTAIDQYITGHCSRNTDDVNNNAYGCLITGGSMCHGYASAFTRICCAAGLEAEEVYGTAKPPNSSTSLHAWSRVRINGEWKYFDPFWNDNKELSKHTKWFMMSEKEISKTHFAERTFAPL